MAPRLSNNNVGDNCTGARNFDNNDFTHCHSAAITTIARYSASVEERATVHCFVQLQEIGLAPRKIRKALVKIRSSGLLGQSVLEKLCKVSVHDKPNTKGSRAIKINNQTFDRSLMVLGRRVHKLREFIHNKGNILVSHSEMLEATNHMAIHGGIYQRRITCSSQRSGNMFGVEHVMFAQKINNILLLR